VALGARAMSTTFRIFGEAPMHREAFLDAPTGEPDDCVLSLRCYDGCECSATCSLQLMAAHYEPKLQLRMLIKAAVPDRNPLALEHRYRSSRSRFFDRSAQPHHVDVSISQRFDGHVPGRGEHRPRECHQHGHVLAHVALCGEPCQFLIARIVRQDAGHTRAAASSIAGVGARTFGARSIQARRSLPPAHSVGAERADARIVPIQRNAGFDEWIRVGVERDANTSGPYSRGLFASARPERSALHDIRRNGSEQYLHHLCDCR
jgi:hypothetical protein